MSAATDPYQRGQAKLAALAERVPADLNEAGTRFQVIDELLLDCLDFPKSEIEVETSTHPGFADYVVGYPGAQFVLEAKREGTTFKLPAGLSGRSTVALKTLLEDKPTAEAIRQCLAYAQQLGVGVAAICNGHQLVVFLASRSDSTPPLSGEALIFWSLQEMVDGFGRLWDYMSRYGLKQKRIHQALAMSVGAPVVPMKLSGSIRGFPGFRERAKRDSDLSILAGVFIQDIEGNRDVSDDFLRECYYESGTLSQYASISRDILKARYKQLPSALGIDTLPIRDKRSIDTSLRQDLLTTSLNTKPVALIGDVGVGKTMFLRHLLRIEAHDLLENALTFYLDFGTRPALQADLQTFVFDEILRQLIDDYDRDVFEDKFVRAVYNGELNRFRKGVFGPVRDSDPPAFLAREIEELGTLTSNPQRHLERVLAHLESTARLKSVIVLDNIDQRPYEFQDELFVTAQALAASLRASVFISLRPSTFFDSKARGTLAAYQPRAFYVEPPRISEVIERRLRFARKQLENAELPMPSEGTTDLTLSESDLLTYLDALQKGFAANSDLVALLDNLSNGNVRIALDLLASFIGSGYVNTERVLTSPKRQGNVYTIPRHEVLRAIIYGDNELYDPTRSRITNLFDIPTDSATDHFLLALLISETEQKGSSGKDAGFVNLGALMKSANAWGYSDAPIRWQLERAVMRGLLEEPITSVSLDEFRITSAGNYLVKTMLAEFAYVDAMISDTPIVDPAVRAQIADVRQIHDRLARAEIFRNYLDASWAPMSGLRLPFDWLPVSAQLKRNIETANERADVAIEKRSRS